MRRSFALSLVLPVLAGTTPPHALADEPASAATAAAAAPREAAPYFVAIQDGLAKLREGEALAAQIAFQRATSLDAAKAEGHYYLGVAMRRNDSLPHAVEAFRHAITRAQASNDLAFEGRARFALAETLGAMGRPQANHAATAWTEVEAFATAHPDAVSPDTVRAYIASRQRVADLATTVEPVRARIHARERETRGR